MSRDRRQIRDLHALNQDGMVLCNPRDREAGTECLPTKTFSYHEGFENSDPVQFRPLFLIA
jgi:hypothetical protein